MYANWSRRKIITKGTAFIGGGMLTATLGTYLTDPSRTLSFFVPATGERKTVTYFDDGVYIEEEVSKIRQVLRDFKTGMTGPIDVTVLDVLHAMMKKYGGYREVEVVRGYIADTEDSPIIAGSPNAYHNSGQGLDVRVTGVTLEHLAMDFVRWVDGGVGVYPKQDFVHIDTGPARKWVG